MKKLFFVFGVLALILSGCATPGTLDDAREKAPKRMQSEVIDHPIDKVHEAAKSAVFNLGLSLESESTRGETRVIYARSPASVTKIIWAGNGYGELVGVYMTPVSETQTNVEVGVQKSNKMEMGYKDYRGLVLNQIKTLLAPKAASQ